MPEIVASTKEGNAIMKIKKAAALPAAIKRTTHERAYLKAGLLSSLKLQVGESLLYLQMSPEKNKQVYWQQFETMLSQYLDLKICGGRI